MQEFFQIFLFSNPFIPHGHCYLWKPELVGLHLISDVLIAFAYFSIPLTLIYFIRQRQDIPFNEIFLLFSAFIVACGTTHLMEVWTLWHPTYWLSGLLKAITAFVSLYTAVMLVSLLPRALVLPSLAATNQKLQESEARFQAFINNSPSAAWISDENGQVIYLSQTYLRTFQLDAERIEDVIGKTAFDLYSAEIAQSIVDNIRLVVETQQVLETVEQAPRPDGKMGSFLVYKFPLQTTSEQRLVGGVAVDITERLRAEQALQQLNQELEARVERRTAALHESEERWQLALRGSNDGIWDWNIKTNQLFLSTRWKEMRGFAEHEMNYISGEERLNQIHPDDRDRVLTALANHLARKTPLFQEEYRVQRQDSSYMWILDRGQALWDEAGNAIRMAGSEKDISERKQIEQALKQSEARHRAIVEEQTELIARFLPDGTIVFVNEAYCRYFGLQREALIGKSYEPVIFEEDQETVTQLLQSISAENPTVTIENRVVVNGEIRWIQWINRMLLDKQRQLVEVQFVGRDITQLKQIETTLQRFERIVSTVRDGMALLDRNYTYQVINQAYLDWCNKSYSEVRGHAVRDILGHELFEKFIKPRLDRCLAGETVQYEKWFDYPNLVPQFLSVSYVPYLDANQNISGIVVSLRDITDLHRTEEALRNLSDRLTLALKSGAIGIWEWDIVRNVLIWDDRMYELYGIQPADVAVAYQLWVNALHPDDRAEAEAVTQEALRGEKEFNPEFRVVHPDGTIRFLKAYALIQRDEQGEVQRMIGINYDITARKKVEQELIRSRALRETIFNESADALFLVDPETVLTLDCNRRAVELFDVANKEELIGIEGHTLQRYQFSPDETMAIQAEMQVKGFWSQEIEYVTRKGHLFWGNLAAKPITVAGTTMNLVRVTDISDRKYAEIQLRQTNEQLARATRLKDEFLANMSHELRTPLNAILGMSEGLQEGVFGLINERQVKAIATIERSGRHLLELINDILDLSKIESGKLELQISDVPVRSLCDSSLAFIRLMALQKNIHLSTHIPDNVGSIQVDERRWRQLLINLLSNAVKFTPDGGSVTLEVRLEEAEGPEQSNVLTPSRLCFCVRDTGIGIAPEDIGKLFQAFVQIDSSLNRQYTGTGLGLALVQQITALHGGTVSVSSEVGRGSCFTVCIPYHSNNEVIRMQVPTPLPTRPFAIDNARVLIIEDSISAAHQMARYLSEYGMQFSIYPYGEGAVEEVLRVQPSLVILDILLPNQSGWEVLTQLKTHFQTQDIPVLIVSVVDERSRGLAGGASEYLVKPITRAELQATLKNLQGPILPESTELIVVPEPTLEPPLILLAEDNLANLDTISSYIESRGYRLILAKDGQQAIALAKAQSPNLIVMDIQMPGIDGLEAIRHIRANGQIHLPIIALTALAMPADQEKCLEAGANEYLTKPIRLKQLVASIEQLLSQSKSQGILP